MSNIRHKIWIITVFATNYTHRGATFYYIPTKILKERNLPLYKFLKQIGSEGKNIDDIPRVLYKNKADILEDFFSELDVETQILKGKYKHRIVRSTFLWFDY